MLVKTLVFLTILTFSFTCVLNADLLGTEHIRNGVIAVYHFESIKKKGDLQYTEDSGPQNLPGSLLEGATLAKNGESGNCLLLKGKATFGSGTRLFPSMAGRGFSIVAWVKRPPQKDEGLVFFMYANSKEDNANVGAITLAITPSGNIKGRHVDFRENISATVATQDQNVSDNKWHHIAYSLYANTYTLFVDGKVVQKHVATVPPGYSGDLLLMGIMPSSKKQIKSSAFVDEVGFFETGFSIYEIQGLYKDGLTEFLKAMSFSP